MKILHIVPTYAPAYRYGGSIKSVHEMNKALVRQGVQVTVFTTTIDGPKDLAVPLGVPVDRDGVTIYYFKPSFPRRWFYSRDLHNALRAQAGDFDLIHITSVFLAASTLGAHYARQAHVPYIISPRGSLMREPLMRHGRLKKQLYLSWIEKKNLCGAKAIHFTAPVEREEYLAMGLPLGRALVIPNGFDAQEFSEIVPRGEFRKRWQISENKKVILFLSRLNWKKGLDLLIPAFADAYQQHPEAVLVIAGGDDEGYLKKVEAMIEKNNIKNAVVITGMLTGADRQSAYQDADCFVLPSYAENFGNVVLEAMHFALPVVISEAVGIAPFILDANAGIVIPPRAENLRKALLMLLGDIPGAQKMGLMGQRFLREHFSWDRTAQAFSAAYIDIAGK